MKNSAQSPPLTPTKNPLHLLQQDFIKIVTVPHLLSLSNFFNTVKVVPILGNNIPLKPLLSCRDTNVIQLSWSRLRWVPLIILFINTYLTGAPKTDEADPRAPEKKKLQNKKYHNSTYYWKIIMSIWIIQMLYITDLLWCPIVAEAIWEEIGDWSSYP